MVENLVENVESFLKDIQQGPVDVISKDDAFAYNFTAREIQIIFEALDSDNDGTITLEDLQNVESLKRKKVGGLRRIPRNATIKPPDAIERLSEKR